VITKMIIIEVIDSSNMGVFGRRLEGFLNEHPEAKILFTALKGIEGGKGIFCILSYIRKEDTKPKPKPEPKKPKVDPEKVKLEKELQDTKDKLAELKALKELEKEEEAEIIEEII